MEVKKGYKISELGLLPEDWKIEKLGRLYEISSSKRVFQNEWKSAGIPFYRARELTILSEKGKVENELFISIEMYQQFKIKYGVPKIGDILVTGVGTLGKVYQVTDENPFYFKDGNIIWFKNCGFVSSSFIKQLYLTPIILKQIEDASAGTTVGTYTISGAKKTIIPFPPTLAEQTAIATALSDTDALITSLENLIDKKRKIKQGAMQELLTGKKRLPGFTGKWEMKRLGEILRLQGGYAFKSGEFMGDGIPIIRISNISDNVVDLEDVVYSVGFQIPEEVIARKGDVLIAMSGATTGKIGVYNYQLPSYINQRVGKFTVYNIQKNDLVFVSHLVRSAKFRDGLQKQIAQGAQPNISGKQIENIELLLPQTIQEQSAIAQILSDMDAEIESLEAKLKKNKSTQAGNDAGIVDGKGAVNVFTLI